MELAEREVTVHRFEQLWHDGDRRAFAIECSSGTYVRSLIADLGDAYCLELRRTRIGAFDVSDADPERPLPLSDALSFLPALRLEGERARRAAHGGVVELAPGENVAGAAVVRLVDAEGLIALARTAPDGGALRIEVGLRALG
jgi:tRNA pseudouridine55 synthase